MSNFDNFLDSLDIEESPSIPTTRNLSEDDFNDVLSEMGFEEAPEVIHDGSDDEGIEEEDYDENQGEGRDLDAEDDAYWEVRNDSGEILSVPRLEARMNENEEIVITDENGREFTFGDLDFLSRDFRVTTASTLGQNQLDEDRAAHFHMPNGVTIDVPIVQEPPAEEETTESSTSEDFLIPPNSPTLLMDDSTSRFSGAEWYNEIRKQRIILAGLGGIGGWTALQLARMSPASLILYDDDVVEMANMSGQLYGNDDIGLSKVDAISRTLQKYTTAQNIFALNQRFTPETEAGSIMICGFDNMEARRTFFNAWQTYVLAKPEEDRNKCLYLDGIMKCLSDNL